MPAERVATPRELEFEPDRLWSLHGRVALVTGASSGLGARATRVLHGAGAHVVATARRAGRLAELAGECGERVETIAGDITDPSHRLQLVERLRALGRLDVLVNNAGIADDGPLEDQTLDDLRRSSTSTWSPSWTCAASRPRCCSPPPPPA
jgi:NADP-dependent 3-hydroxy acid dehydrogenase YdfG